MTYQCRFAKRESGRIQCTKLGSCCGHVKFCAYEGRWKLTEAAQQCPAAQGEENKNG